MAIVDALLERNTAKTGLVPVSLAVADYDRTRPLIDGRVIPEGIALQVAPSQCRKDPSPAAQISLEAAMSIAYNRPTSGTITTDHALPSHLSTSE